MKIKLSAILITLIFVLSTSILFAQDFANTELNIGEWKLHVPYQKGKTLCKAGNKIYVLAQTGIYYYDLITKKTKIITDKDGYSNFKGAQLVYVPKSDAVVIVYENLGIDIIKNDKVRTINDLRDKVIIGIKKINRIRLIEDEVFIVSGFAIIKLNVDKAEFGDSYYLSPSGQNFNLRDIQLFKNNYYVSSDSGILKIEKNNPFILDYKSWKRETFNGNNNWRRRTYNNMTVCYDRLYVHNNNDKEYQKDTLFSLDNAGIWRKSTFSFAGDVNRISTIDNELVVNYFNFADFMFVFDENYTIIRSGIFSSNYNIIETISDDAGNYIVLDQNKGLYLIDKKMKAIDSFPVVPNGTFFETAFRMQFLDSTLYVSGGRYNESGFANFLILGVQSYKNNNWTYEFKGDNEIPGSPFSTTMSCNLNPKNKNNKFYTSFVSGVIEENIDSATQKKQYTLYRKNNSELREQPGNLNFYGINNTFFDIDNNIWMDNAYVTKPLVVKTKDNKWYSFGTGQIGRTRQLFIDRNGLKWLVYAEKGVVVYDDKKTLDNPNDDVLRTLNTNFDNGAFNTNFLNCIAEDDNGDMWIGSDKGIYVCYNTSSILQKNSDGNFNNYQAQQVKINSIGRVEYLLEAENINCIIVDKANRKWIGTKSSGVYCVSANGTEQIYHFTTKNSPLLDDDIMSLAINNSNGELFIGTAFGVQSYKTEVTNPSNDCNSIFVYPNPIENDYDGSIVVKNLKENSIVNIIDLNGRLVAKTNALGGQAIWNGNNFEGRRVPPGIYTVITLNSESKKGCKTKLLIKD